MVKNILNDIKNGANVVVKAILDPNGKKGQPKNF